MKGILSIERKRTVFYLVLITTLGLSIRFYYFPFDVPIASDGFFSFVYASKIIFEGTLPVGYTTTNTGWAYLLSAIFTLTDKTDPFQLMMLQRVSTVIISSLTIIPMYFLLKKFVSSKLAIFGCLLFTLEPRLLFISLEGINYPLFVFIFVTAITLFLKRTNLSITLSFICIALISLVRYEGILLLIPFSIMFIIFNKNKKNLWKLIGLISIVALILIPVAMIRMDVTSEICYNTIFGEICGRDGIFDNYVNRAESISDKIVGNADHDDPIYNKNEPMFGHFLWLSFSGLLKFLMIICIPYFFIFIGLSFIIIWKRNFKLKKEHVFIIFATCVALLPAIYAYGRGIEDYRYVLLAIPLLTIFSMKIMESILKFDKLKKSFPILIIIVILFSVVFLEIEKSDNDLHVEAFHVSKIVNELTNTINDYQYSGYIKTVKILEEWPEVPDADISRLGKLKSSEVKISTEGYQNIDQFLDDSYEIGLKYIVIDEKRDFFKDILTNPEKYDKLEMVFDSRDLEFKNEFRIYKISGNK